MSCNVQEEVLALTSNSNINKDQVFVSILLTNQRRSA